MKTWFTSDFHMGHYNILEYCSRPYTSVLEMGEAITSKFNSVVASEDRVYFLGDFCMNHRYFQMDFPKFNGKWIFIYGNHDAIWKKPKLREEYLSLGVEELHERLEIEHNGRKYLLCHLPWMDPLSVDQRYMERRPLRADYPKTKLIHGHCHSAPEHRLGTDSIDCGVDGNGFMPYSFEEIEELLNV